jgi:endonuclease YncB( thermonuclease family)
MSKVTTAKHIVNPNKLFNFKNKKVEEPDAPYWLNLDTSRKITVLHKEQYGLRGHRFVGTEQEIVDLFNDNAQIPGDFKDLLYQPFSDLPSLVSSYSCDKNKSIAINKDMNIRDVDTTLLTGLCPFTLYNLFTEAYITSVHDGDTLNCAIVLSTRDLSTCGKGKNCSLLQQEGKIVTVFTCRLFGIDSAELNTDAGKVQRDITKRDLEGKYVWILFLGEEKYGRELAVIYLDAEGKKLYQPQGVAYLGGKKEQPQ